MSKTAKNSDNENVVTSLRPFPVAKTITNY